MRLIITLLAGVVITVKSSVPILTDARVFTLKVAA
jgi:hypothetical protein